MGHSHGAKCLGRAQRGFLAMQTDAKKRFDQTAMLTIGGVQIIP